MSEQLIAIGLDRVMGTLERDKAGKLSFTYEEAWRQDSAAFPLSLSMPLVAARHPHAVVEPFLWGLLPDNERVLDRWAREFQVSARSCFGLLAHVGEDCAGAVQFARPDRRRALLAGGKGSVAWLDENQVAARLRVLREDHTAWRNPEDVGQFSLAGAQPKTAFLIEGKRIGVPAGRTPTTHILKPPTRDFDGHAENEHFCLALARMLGLPAASSEVRRFRDEVAIVVERFDRVRVRSAAGRTTKARILRVHQEDCCQALGVLPTLKYQSEGGPTPQDIVQLLRAYSSDPVQDVARFVDALAFNWLIAGTDAHAKNYAIMLGVNRQARLAPLYDLSSALGYPSLDPRRLKLAMKVGTSYRLHEIGRYHFRKLAQACSLDADRVLLRVAELAEALPAAAKSVRADVRREGLDHPILDKLTKSLSERAATCARAVQ